MQDCSSLKKYTSGTENSEGSNLSPEGSSQTARSPIVSASSPKSRFLPIEANSVRISRSLDTTPTSAYGNHGTGILANFLSRRTSPGSSPMSNSLVTSPTCCDSRIPRPSPTALRRSASLRLRGERMLPTGSCSGAAGQFHQLRSSNSPCSTTLFGHHQNNTSNQQLNHQQLHSSSHHQNQPVDHRVFPVITENGTESPRQRSFSLSLTPARPRSLRAASGGSTYGGVGGIDDSDLESLRSYGSACSTASACDHATFALNGTTWSARSKKYVVHCSNHNGDNEHYLTPTQRAVRQVRKFQALLKEAKNQIDEKDREICKLTKEVVELRLYKASLNSPDDRTDSSDALTVRENNPYSPETPCKDLPVEEAASLEKNVVAETQDVPDTPKKCMRQSDLPSSLADSGLFEDGSVHSKDSVLCLPDANLEFSGTTSTTAVVDSALSISQSPSSISRSQNSPDRSEESRRLVDLYEERIEKINRKHVDEFQDMKQTHNDKVEILLAQLAEVNKCLCELRPSVDAAESRAKELEHELEAVKFELDEQKALLAEQEERNKQMYLKMYAKGQEAARIEQADRILEHASLSPPKVTVAELLQQLTVTQAELENVKDTSYSPEPHISAECSQNLLSAQEAVSLWVLGTRKAMYRRIVEARSNQGILDPEITLQFLKSAIYYFLTDKENHQGHLNAIESILGFTDAEKHNIDKLYRSARK